MGFWDKLKGMVGGGGDGDGAPPPDSDVARRVEAVVVRRVTRKEAFEAIVVADEVVSDPAERTVKGIAAACAVVARLHEEGRLAPLGYTRTKLNDGNWLYHPAGHDVASYGQTSGLPATRAVQTQPAQTRPAQTSAWTKPAQTAGPTRTWA